MCGCVCTSCPWSVQRWHLQSCSRSTPLSIDGASSKARLLDRKPWVSPDGPYQPHTREYGIMHMRDQTSHATVLWGQEYPNPGLLQYCDTRCKYLYMRSSICLYICLRGRYMYQYTDKVHGAPPKPPPTDTLLPAPPLIQRTSMQLDPSCRSFGRRTRTMSAPCNASHSTARGRIYQLVAPKVRRMSRATIPTRCWIAR